MSELIIDSSNFIFLGMTFARKPSKKKMLEMLHGDPVVIAVNASKRIKAKKKKEIKKMKAEYKPTNTLSFLY